MVEKSEAAGATNLGFVKEDSDIESEDENENRDEFEDRIGVGNNNISSSSSVSRIKKISAAGSESSQVSEERSGAAGGGGRRRSSAEAIRQSKPFKRVSRAFSSVGLFLPEITEYTLVGITEEVRRRSAYLKNIYLAENLNYEFSSATDERDNVF
jgi:hypothetical protein